PLLCSRSYSHALDGLYRVAREEGLKKLFSGATMASSRGALVTVGQLSCYDQAKHPGWARGRPRGSVSPPPRTHVPRLSPQGGCATFLCQPLDVLKTRLMSSQGEYKVRPLGVSVRRLGTLAGFFPAAIRLVPHTILTFVFLEQLRKYFGIKIPA
uniref:Uncharacterized protein n=1 Tax=Ornithorhynchus anatinus TaxID=9258 RepID=F6SG97_ORNAN